MKLEELLTKPEISEIKKQYEGEDKISYLSRNSSLLEILAINCFNGFHVSQIVVGKGWKDKLDWVRDNYETVLKSRGFNQYQTAKILYGKEWLEKIEWIKDKYNESTYTPEQVRKAMVRKNWKEELGYAA